MSDLDKMMQKLKKTTPKKEETSTPEIPETPTEEEFEDDFEDDEEETSEDEETAEESDPIPANESHEQSIEGEVAVLQNDGVFRRELLLTLKELVDVHKVNTQTLLDLKKKFDLEDGTTKTK